MTVVGPASTVSMRHLITLTDDRGIFEHAKFAEPRFSHGYCTDDNARLLIVAARDEGRSFASRSLAHIAMQFLLDAQAGDGSVRNRMSMERIWMDEPGNQDCWGRSMWAFGAAAGYDHDSILREQAVDAFNKGASIRSRSLRTMSFAALGAHEILRVDPGNMRAVSIMQDAADLLGPHKPGNGWLWPEPRLTYANAVIPEALLAIGDHLENPSLLHRGLDLLAWLIAHESFDGHLSVTPVGGRGPGDPQPAFDQQPIEVAAIADAAHRAYLLTGESRWRHALELAVQWFLGSNDAGQLMIDPLTDGGYDGLHADSVNKNQGAESTLAMIATMQHSGRNGTTRR